jgi:hypothetical protein
VERSARTGPSIVTPVSESLCESGGDGELSPHRRSETPDRADQAGKSTAEAGGVTVDAERIAVVVLGRRLRNQVVDRFDERVFEGDIVVGPVDR